MFKELMQKLRGAKTAEQWDSAIAAIEGSVSTVTANLGMLRSALRSAPFEQTEEEIVALRQRVRDHEDELEFLQGALEEAHRRRDEATETERTQEVEKRMAEARKDWDRMARLWGIFDAALAAAEKPLEELKDLHSRLVEANNFAAEMGRGDLALRLSPVEASGQIRNMLRKIGEQSRTNTMQHLVATDRVNMPPGIPGFGKGKWDK